MKIYKVHMSMVLVMGRLKKFKLGNYNYNNPIIFQTARDPDEACHKTHMGLTEILINQYGSSVANAADFTRDIMQDVRVTKIVLANNDKLP